MRAELNEMIGSDVVSAAGYQKSIESDESLSWPEIIGDDPDEVRLAQSLRSIRLAELDELEADKMRLPETSKIRSYDLTKIRLMRVHLSHFDMARWWIDQREGKISHYFEENVRI
jgi:hypothetical protein